MFLEPLILLAAVDSLSGSELGGTIKINGAQSLVGRKGHHMLYTPVASSLYHILRTVATLVLMHSSGLYSNGIHLDGSCMNNHVPTPSPSPTSGGFEVWASLPIKRKPGADTYDRIFLFQLKLLQLIAGSK